MLSFKDRLSEILINGKLITRPQLEQALKSQSDSGGNLSDIITGFKFAKPQQICDALKAGMDMPVFDLRHFEIDPIAVKIIPVNTARRFQIIPISKTADSLSLAMADPLNIFIAESLPELEGFKINPLIFSAKEIKEAVQLHYPAVFKVNINDLIKEISSPVEIIGPEKEVVFSPEELERVSREPEVVKATSVVLEEAVKRKASEILIEPFDKKLRIRFRIAGMLKDQDIFPKEMHVSIISRLKAIANLNPEERSMPQEGRFNVHALGRQVDFNISIIPTTFGEKAALRVLDKSWLNLDIKELGLSSHSLQVLENACRLSQGLVLVAGPALSGKTTTLYSILKSLNTLERNIVTIENPVECQLEGINQVTVNPGIGFSFAVGMRSILLQDPNVIMVAEVNDYQTIDIVVKSALSGHLVFAGFNADSACGALVRLLNMGVAPYLINSSLAGVIAQRLLRRLCPHCKTPYTAPKELLESLRMNGNKNIKPQLYKAKGCRDCLNTGYSGNVVISEALQLSQRMRELVLGACAEPLIRQEARLEGMQSLRQAGFEAVLNGHTTIEEAMRVTSPDA